MIIKIVPIFVICFGLIACKPKPKNDSNNSISTPMVSIATDLEAITITNAADFMVSGTCSEEGQPVEVSVGELSPETAPTCANRAWSVRMDLTSLSGASREISITADHARGNRVANQATGVVLLHPRVFIDANLMDVTSTNEDTFRVSGTCSEDEEPITVSVGDLSPDADPTCSNGIWSIVIDVTSLSEAAGLISITADHSSSGGLSAVQATESVTVLPRVLVATNLNDITAANAAAFTVSGTCSEDGRPVTVNIDGMSPMTPNCATGVWTIDNIDVTGLNKMEEISITADHSSSGGLDAPQSTQTVTNSFICPANYVGVPELANYTTNSFCVMKYEAKSDGSDTDADDDTDDNNALAQATGLPYVSIDRDTAIVKCAGLNGAGETKHDLITNDEWQSLARNIELVGDNWATGSVASSGGLSYGYVGLSPTPTAALAASSNDNDGCMGTGQTCNGTTWNANRRTHTLSNGEVIWDVAGNVSELVKDDNSSKYGDNANMSQVTNATHTARNALSGGTTNTSRRAKNQFGPNRNYSSSTDPRGLGRGDLNYDDGGVLRGNSYSSSSAGVFGVDLSIDHKTGLADVGFRCAFHP